MGYHYPPVAGPSGQPPKQTSTQDSEEPRRGALMKTFPRPGTRLDEGFECSLNESFERAGRGIRVIPHPLPPDGDHTGAAGGSPRKSFLFGDSGQPCPRIHQSRPADRPSPSTTVATLVLKMAWPAQPRRGRVIYSADPCHRPRFMSDRPCPWSKVSCAPVVLAVPYLGHMWTPFPP